MQHGEVKLTFKAVSQGNDHQYVCNLHVKSVPGSCTLIQQTEDGDAREYKGSFQESGKIELSGTKLGQRKVTIIGMIPFTDDLKDLRTFKLKAVCKDDWKKRERTWDCNVEKIRGIEPATVAQTETGRKKRGREDESDDQEYDVQEHRTVTATRNCRKRHADLPFRE